MIKLARPITLTSDSSKNAFKYYTYNGKKYPRMTNVLDVIAKPEFYRWYAKEGYDECQNIINKRASFGTRVHAEFEKILLGKDAWVDSDEMRATVESFIKWKKKFNVSPKSDKHLEIRLYSDTLGVAGTADFVGLYDGLAYLIDWKTSKAVYDNYLLQISGYLYIYEEQFGEELDGCGIVSFRDGHIRTKFLSRDEAYALIPIVKAAVTLYKWKFRWDK
jgi:hypothetical protein